MGLGDFDFFGFSWGWWLDDVHVYNCSSQVCVDCAAVEVTIGGTPKGSYTLAFGWVCALELCGGGQRTDAGAEHEQPADPGE